ncbi:DUF4097 domain-containing protein [Alkaliphilus pronyensis]|uniref:DUF4097 domain-containing protein n=1 Tax=Alkaliphilus pronyensis TaxID=1482732 RepID=A0A6I0F4Q0_9FIRM|nr:hypothetical protein [Alkaliphilus pronyensis]KAB3537851.1 DUF4097 domain-containing protein [Alkaliphilus pronyensis]
MSDEKLMILKLLEEGKISKEEALKLLQALESDSDESTANYSYTSNNKGKKHKKIHIHLDDDLEGSFENFGEKMDDFGRRMEDFGERFGEKMSHLGVRLAEKSMGFAEKILDFVEENIDVDSLSKYDSNSNYEKYEEVYNVEAPDNFSFLNFMAKNGKIYLSSWEEDTISVKASIRTLSKEYESRKPIMQVKKESSSISFFPKDIEKLMVELEVFVPSKHIDTIKVHTNNASIYVEDIKCNNLGCSTKNASIVLNNVNVNEETSCSTTNARIMCNSIIANHVLAVTKNAKVILDNAKLRGIETITTNSKIVVNNLIYDNLELIHLKTSNGKIEINGPIPPSIGVNFEAATTNGSIKTPFNMIYKEKIVGSNTKLSGKTSNYESCDKVISIKAYTTNDNIVITN